MPLRRFTSVRPALPLFPQAKRQQVLVTIIFSRGTGGWYCFNRENCNTRYDTMRRLMSSNEWPLTKTGKYSFFDRGGNTVIPCTNSADNYKKTEREGKEGFTGLRSVAYVGPSQSTRHLLITAPAQKLTCVIGTYLHMN